MSNWREKTKSKIVGEVAVQIGETRSWDGEVRSEAQP